MVGAPRLRNSGMVLALAACSAGLRMQAVAAPVVLNDPIGDGVPRPMDPGAILPFDKNAHRLPDLVSVSLGSWMPADPRNDLFAGSWDLSGEFVRIEIRLKGLANPPGPVEPWNFDPFRYGDHPVYGFVEIDMDGDVDTGGELNAPQYRYLGNAVRFGGRVLSEVHRDRVAESAEAFDGDFETPPFVERHGEEFHVALLGDVFAREDITIIAGDGDSAFEIDEIWNLRGSFFHRAHGYEPFSFVKGGRTAGEYAPVCDLQFRHDPSAQLTHVTLVFPLTNIGAGLMRGQPPQPTNHDPTDHASVLEALEDLQLSAFFLPIFPTDLPEEAIIMNWAEREPADYLDPSLWRATVVLGSSYTEASPAGVFFVWSDIYPDVVSGDVDGSGAFDGRDRQAIAQYIAMHDSDDGEIDGVVTIPQFAADFSIFDIHHDGVVDAFDLVPAVLSGDGDGDGDVDLRDFALLQSCFGAGVAATCRALDLNRDLIIDLDDLVEFQARFTGPTGG